jgi:hypothetical protein
MNTYLRIPLSELAISLLLDLPNLSLSELTERIHNPYTKLRQTPYADILEMYFVWYVLVLV